MGRYVDMPCSQFADAGNLRSTLSDNCRYLDFVHFNTGGKPRHKGLTGLRGVFGMLAQTGNMRKSRLAPRHNHQAASRAAVTDLAHPPLQTRRPRV